MKLRQYLEKFEPDQVCTVNGNEVWDYKSSDDFTKIYLISEPVEGNESYDRVAACELYEFAGMFQDTAEVIDESTGKSVKKI